MINELRINNWVQDAQHFMGYFQVQGVKSEYNGFVETPEIWIPKEEVLPIVLTSEWLENKFGFMCENRMSQNFKKYLNEVNSDCCYVQLKQVGEPVWTVGFIDKWCVNPYKKEIRFVHQLQNLWFMYADYDLETVAQHSI